MTEINRENKANKIINHFMAAGATVSKKDYDYILSCLETEDSHTCETFCSGCPACKPEIEAQQYKEHLARDTQPEEPCICGKNTPNTAIDSHVQEPAIHSPTYCGQSTDTPKECQAEDNCHPQCSSHKGLECDCGQPTPKECEPSRNLQDCNCKHPFSYNENCPVHCAKGDPGCQPTPPSKACKSEDNCHPQCSAHKGLECDCGQLSKPKDSKPTQLRLREIRENWKLDDKGHDIAFLLTKLDEAKKALERISKGNLFSSDVCAHNALKSINDE